MSFRAYHHSPVHNLVQRNTKLEGKYSLDSTDPRESEIRAHCVRNSLFSEFEL